MTLDDRDVDRGLREHSETPTWQPEPIRLKPLQLLVSLVITAVALAVTAAILPGVYITTPVAHFSSPSSSAR